MAAQQQQQQQQQSSRGECTDACRTRRRELETEASEARTAKHWAEEKCAALERENAALAEQLRETDILMSALSAMQEKTAHLENSLSAENRIKLDLFSALGEAKRQLEIRDSKYYFEINSQQVATFNIHCPSFELFLKGEYQWHYIATNVLSK